MAIDKRYIINTRDEHSGWLEIQDWRLDEDDGEPRIEVVAKRDGPEAIGEEDVRLWLSTGEAQELAEVLDAILDRAGMVIAEPQL
jgi:hypothetical protein